MRDRNGMELRPGMNVACYGTIVREEGTSNRVWIRFPGSDEGELHAIPLARVEALPNRVMAGSERPAGNPSAGAGGSVNGAPCPRCGWTNNEVRTLCRNCRELLPENDANRRPLPSAPGASAGPSTGGGSGGTIDQPAPKA